MKNILVLCTGNSCRSQVMQGYLGQLLKDKATVYSAGIAIHGVNPYAIRCMAADGIDISKHTSNHVSEYKDIAFDYIITVCDHANENCPYLPGLARRFHHAFPDPAGSTGTEQEILGAFDAVRDFIKAYCQRWVKKEFE